MILKRFGVYFITPYDKCTRYNYTLDKHRALCYIYMTSFKAARALFPFHLFK